MRNQKGRVLVICAPSGTGKTTLAKRLMDEFPKLNYSVSCTTREPRPGEIHGEDYFFLDKEEFNRRILNNEFIEWAEVHGNNYGTLRSTLESTLNKGEDLLFDIDVQGAAQMRLNLPGKCTFVFIVPPSIEALEQRLLARGSESEETIKRRMANARGEIANAHWFDYIIVNEQLEEAYSHLRAAYLASGFSPSHRTALINSLLVKYEHRI